jgi:hypothetical protein
MAALAVGVLLGNTVSVEKEVGTADIVIKAETVDLEDATALRVAVPVRVAVLEDVAVTVGMSPSPRPAALCSPNKVPVSIRNLSICMGTYI